MVVQILFEPSTSRFPLSGGPSCADSCGGALALLLPCAKAAAVCALSPYFAGSLRRFALFKDCCEPFLFFQFFQFFQFSSLVEQMVAVMPGDDGDAHLQTHIQTHIHPRTLSHAPTPTHTHTHTHTDTPSHIHPHPVRPTKEQDAHMGFPASSIFFQVPSVQ